MTDATELDETAVRARHQMMPTRGASEDVAFLLAALDEAREEVERLNLDVMAHQVGEGYEKGYEHGSLAGIQHYERMKARALAAESALAAIAKLRDQWRENAGDDRDIESRVLRSVADHIDTVIR